MQSVWEFLILRKEMLAHNIIDELASLVAQLVQGPLRRHGTRGVVMANFPRNHAQWQMLHPSVKDAVQVRQIHWESIPVDHGTERVPTDQP